MGDTSSEIRPQPSSPARGEARRGVWLKLHVELAGGVRGHAALSRGRLSVTESSAPGGFRTRRIADVDRVRARAAPMPCRRCRSGRGWPAEQADRGAQRKSHPARSSSHSHPATSLRKRVTLLSAVSRHAGIENTGVRQDCQSRCTSPHRDVGASMPPRALRSRYGVNT